MRLPVKLIVKNGKLRQDGTKSISIQYCHTATKRTVIKTGINIPPQYWNKKTGRISAGLPPEFGKVEEIEGFLTTKLRKAEDMITHAKKLKTVCPMAFLKNNLHLSDEWQIDQMKEDRNELDVFYNIDKYIEERSTEVKPNTLDVIRQMRYHLKTFETYRQEPITFKSFDFDFYQKFIRFLTYNIPLRRRKLETKGLKINTLGKSIKWLKIFLSNQMAKRLIPVLDLSAYKVLEEDVDTIYLNWKEISTMYRLDLSDDKFLETIRDEFILGCLTGFRFSDYVDVKPDEIRDGMLYITQTKTAGRIVVPLRPETKLILEKYNMEMPKISNPDFNYYIKIIAKKAKIDEPVKFAYRRGNQMIEETRPKHNWVMSHTCRRSFCTNEFLDGTPMSLIMAISGHKTEKAFRKYIKADNLQKALMIKKLWEGRPGL